MITSRGAAFATGQRSFAGAGTRRRSNAHWSRWNTAKANPSPFSNVLPRQARLGDFPEAVENLVLSAVDCVNHVKRAAFSENEMSRIGSPGRILSGRNGALAASPQFEHHYLKLSAASHIERDFLPVR